MNPQCYGANKYILNKRLKQSAVIVRSQIISRGEFQTVESATEKSVLHQNCGTASR